MTMLVLVSGALEAMLCVGLLVFLIIRGGSADGSDLEEVTSQRDERKALLAKVETMLTELVPASEVRTKGQALILAKEALKTERGRVTITQAELETVEGRLRELEEIERELEASGIETKEEINILQKKEKELSSKNDGLKQQIQVSTSQIDKLLGEITANAELHEKVQSMKSELLQTLEKIDLLMVQIEQGNEQYFTMKRRYDALDIEYAQLFEKFSEAEAAAGRGK